MQADAFAFVTKMKYSGVRVLPLVEARGLFLREERSRSLVGGRVAAVGRAGHPTTSVSEVLKVSGFTPKRPNAYSQSG